MNSIAFLKAAYTFAWIVYLGYLVRILLRIWRVGQELKQVSGVDSSAPTPNVLAPEAQRQRA